MNIPPVVSWAADSDVVEPTGQLRLACFDLAAYAGGKVAVAPQQPYDSMTAAMAACQSDPETHAGASMYFVRMIAITVAGLCVAERDPCRRCAGGAARRRAVRRAQLPFEPERPQRQFGAAGRGDLAAARVAAGQAGGHGHGRGPTDAGPRLRIDRRRFWLHHPARAAGHGLGRSAPARYDSEVQHQVSGLDRAGTGHSRRKTAS